MTNAILTCSEHFNDLALNELHRSHPQLTLLRSLSPQHLLVKFPGQFRDLSQPWQDHPPIYLHHLFPVYRTIPLEGTAADFALLRQQAKSLCPAPRQVQARVAGDYPYSAVSIAQAIAPGQSFSDTAAPQDQILSILIADHSCYMGFSRASENLSPFATGRPSFEEPVPNRAGLKLLEAISTFKIRLHPDNHALDLGAAPGGWTEILRRRGLMITAVAPRPMYDWLQNDPNVRHFEMTAEEYLLRCNSVDTIYDLILNDMKLDARDSARLMVQYAPYLRPEGIAIMTLKLRLNNARRVMDHAFRLLRKKYRIIRVRQLVSNRKEVTLFLRRK